ncbi:hypothetical protein EauS123_00021 [Exiguobacterium phage vB_EauS-123]|nr:hypothetical protein EauS123_00021 [Exiguobacterium phage vB_EauS-123]
MNIKVYMKDGREFDIAYPARKDTSKVAFECNFIDAEEMIQASKADTEALSEIKRVLSRDKLLVDEISPDEVDRRR